MRSPVFHINAQAPRRNGISRIPKMPRSIAGGRLYFARRFSGGIFDN
jgi:hypothetical protein